MKFTALICSLLVAYASADCYMQNPKGSNDRLNGQAANRANGNRLFDSQNNNRGGYNACDKGTNAAANNAANLYYKSANRENANPDAIYGDNTARNDAVQYPMMYYAGSQLQMEWTVQHGCGGNEITDPNKLNCNMVIQYMCDQDVKIGQGQTRDNALSVFLADGLNTNTPDTTGPGNNGNNCNQNQVTTVNNIQNRQAANDAAARGRHEGEAWYCECQQRNRDKGLFNADQNLNGNRAQYTRQNPNGGRRGLECPEERDYFPYGPPSPFRDLAYLTDDMSRCAMIQSESMNVKPHGKCQLGNGDLNRAVTQNIDSVTCTQAGGQWNTYSYGIPPPDCQQAGYSRVNHLGNGRGDGVSPETLGYNATIPSWKTLTSATIKAKLYPANAAENYAKCIMRLRYNVSTDDYDPWTVDASKNGDASPVTQNPNVAVGASAKLQLAINTNQFGRTFQDRSHVFFVKQPSAEIAAAVTAGRSIINLNVRGKRGNIVQTFPATEYDFVPQNAAAAAGDLVHLQYCGSNTHNNGNPGGDGQTGDAGEGTGGTDRQNLVQQKDFDDNFPAPYEKITDGSLGMSDFFSNKCYIAHQGLAPAAAIANGLDCAVRVATSGYYKGIGDVGARNMNPTLDNTPASTTGAGTIIEIAATAKAGTMYRYMATRNNNFTNRGMKGELTVMQPRTPPAAAPAPIAPIAGR